MKRVTKILLFSLVGTFLAGDAISAPADKKAKLSPSERIDLLVVKNLREQGLEPNPLTRDEVFVRRVYLDLIGRIPTKTEATSFFESDDPGKRRKLVASLIGSDGYVSHQFNYWADLLRARTTISGNGQSVPAGLAYEQWIKQSIRENKPYDELVYELVTATGSSWENPAVGYYLRDYGMPLDNLAITTQVFLGTQVVCAQCHDHPFDEWTQMDYYHLSAFTYPLVTSNNIPLQREATALLQKRKGKIHPDLQQDLRRAFSEILFPVRFNNVYETKRGLRLPHDYQYDDAKPRSVVKPATIMGKEAVLSPSKSTVEAFGEWLTDPENPRFTTVIANRMWKRAFGVGLIEPVDDFKSHTTASNPELMSYLEKLLIDLDYDLQRFQRILYSTKTYQREASREEVVPGSPYHFAGPILRRMTAEQIWDSLVALAVENPDQPSAQREHLAKRRLTAVQLVAEAIYDQTPAEFLRSGQEIAKVQKELSIEIEAAQEKVTRAREEGDPDLIKEANSEAREIRQRLYRIVQEKVYMNSLVKKLGELEPTALVEGAAGEDEGEFLGALALAMGGSGGMETAMTGGASMKGGSNYSRTSGIIDTFVDAMLAEEEAELHAAREEEQEREKKAWKVKSRDDIANYRNFTQIKRRMQRASEINSPAPPGHFLREFGQSDRELVENASDEASITQALALLNGPTLGAVTNRFSVLSRSREGSTFQERLDSLYLSMMSRLPTSTERELFRDAWKEDPGKGTTNGIVWTLLNTREFLFIQ